MACCSVMGQKYWLAGCSSLTLLLALIIALIWPPIAYKLLYPQLVLKEGSTNYDNWIVTPIPIYFEIYMFNWTNPEQVHNLSTKPHFVEMGPYVFKEKHIRTNLTWNNNGTVSFYQKRIWHFDEERSNGSLSDNITNYNVIAATVAYSSRYFSNNLKTVLGILMGGGRGAIAITRKVEELLFEGYEDPLLTIIKAIGNPDIPKPPFEKFGWFVERNNSETYDGEFTMFTGDDDIYKLGNLQLWNKSEVAHHYRGDCDKVSGTTGELLPPLKDGQYPPLSIFATDICRSVSLKYESSYKAQGIQGYKWVADESVFDNGIKYPNMKCYCSASEDSCPDLLPGVFNVSSCKFGAPAFVSFPHFYLAHEYYREGIEGMNPSKAEHEFSLAAEPRTGIPLRIRAQLQINLMMKSYPWTPIRNVPEVMMPMFWFRQVAELTPELAGQARLAVFLPDFGNWAAWSLCGVAGLLVIIGGFCFVYRWRRVDEEDEELLN